MSINRNEIIDCLINGGVVLFPTDTVYGLAASPLHDCAIDKIFELKSRPKDRHLPIMVASIRDLELLGLDINSYALKLLESSLIPGALSIVLGFKNPPTLTWLQGRDEIAFRIPNEDNLLFILGKTGPLLVTSANKHGLAQTPSTVSEALLELNGTPAMVIDDGIRKEIPSTIVNCRFSPPVIERQGIVTAVEIFKILNNE